MGRREQEKVSGQRHLHCPECFDLTPRARSGPAIGASQEIVDGFPIEPVTFQHCLPGHEHKEGGMLAHHCLRAVSHRRGSMHRLAQFPEIIGRGDADEQVSTWHEDPGAFRWVASGVEREHQPHAPVDEWQPSVGVGDYPREVRKVSGRTRHRGCGDVEANGLYGTEPGQRSEHLARARAEIDDWRARR